MARTHNADGAERHLANDVLTQDADVEHADAAEQTSSSRARQDIEQDRYDLVERSGRVGVHRAATRNASAWLRALIVALITAILATLGIVFLVIGPGNVQLPGAIDEPGSGPVVVEVVGKVDAATTVTILNGTPADGLETSVEQTVSEGGWGTVSFAGTTTERAVEITAVFYVDPKDEALAKGLGEKLGGASYYQQAEYESYGTQLVVLLGQDYRGPGAVDMPADASPDPAAE